MRKFFENRVVFAAGVFAVFAAFILALKPIQVSAEVHPNRWVLFYIGLNQTGDRLERLGEYDTMVDCFDAWTKAEDLLPKPKIDFHIICIQASHENLQPLQFKYPDFSEPARHLDR